VREGSMEIVRPPKGYHFRFALFDFDGTLSLIREGWPDVMVPMMVEHLSRLNAGLSTDRLRRMMARDVEELTGRQTIYQMIRFAQRVREHGGKPLSPRRYKAEYDRRLMKHIARRRAALAAGSVRPDRMLLAGSRNLLEALRARGLVLCLASGTDRRYVLEEAELLDISRYFGRHIYGALDDYEASSKKKVIQRLAAANRIRPRELLVFGDGFVEIENCREAHGYAVGVASDEAAGGGRIDPRKRRRLLAAGADMIVPDYRQLEELLERIFEA